MKSFKKKKVAAEPIVEEVKEEIKEETIEEVAEEAENVDVPAEAEAGEVEEVIEEPAKEEKPRKRSKKEEEKIEEPVAEEVIEAGDLVILKELEDYAGEKVEEAKVYRVKDIVGDKVSLKFGGLIVLSAKLDNLVKVGK